jgi:hypothetical protein
VTQNVTRNVETVADVGLGPVDVGSMLFTLVQPHPGYEVAYNRWYERDHFYAGCMVGPYNFAGRRWVATRRLKALRRPAGAPGSYLALYWVLAGHHQEWNRWAYRELKQLHADGRMFDHRDHVHTLLYTREDVEYRDPDPVPAALALDHPYKGLVVTMGSGQPADVPLPAAAAIRIRWSPMPLLVDAPGVAKDEGGPDRFLDLYFLEADPEDVWDQFADVGGDPAVEWIGPFIPTIVGTDTYTDEL